MVNNPYRRTWVALNTNTRHLTKKDQMPSVDLHRRLQNLCTITVKNCAKSKMKMVHVYNVLVVVIRRTNNTELHTDLHIDCDLKFKYLDYIYYSTHVVTILNIYIPLLKRTQNYLYSQYKVVKKWNTNIFQLLIWLIWFTFIWCIAWYIYFITCIIKKSNISCRKIIYWSFGRIFFPYMEKYVLYFYLIFVL